MNKLISMAIVLLAFCSVIPFSMLGSELWAIPAAVVGVVLIFIAYCFWSS